jgi:thermitase
MRLMFRGEPVTLQSLDSVVAIRPSAELAAAESRAGILKHFRTAAAATADPALPISPTARRLFAHAGWIFAEAHATLAKAARAPSPRRRNATLPVYLDPGKNTLLGTWAVTVQLDPGMTVAQARARMKEDGLTGVERLKFGTNLFAARLPAGQPLDEAVAALQGRRGYVFAEPVFLQVIQGRQSGPDPDLVRQWHHENQGTGTGRKNCDIRSPGAWKTTRGAGVRIAVIDNGMQVDHPDLAAGIVSGGFFVDDKAGEAAFHPYRPGQAFPDDYHGTFCMGMAAARRNNGQGGCGSAPEAQLMAIACAPDQVGTQLTLARAVSFAADPGTEASGLTRSDGADVLACSLGSEDGSWTMTSILEQAITRAATEGRAGRGLPIFWAVSNNSKQTIDHDQVCSHPDVIAVGASGPCDIRGECASGPKLDFLAPGVDVFSTCSGGGYDTDTGTSYACPLAAGVAALVLSRFPDWTRDQVRDRLSATCDPIARDIVEYGPDGRNPDYGRGRINADRAVNDPVP